ncbi:MAG: hypothetical protein ABW079_06660 [Sedimenticola sp.]
MDYTAITSAVDWAGVLTGLGAVALAIAGLNVAIRGARILVGFIRR